VLAIGRNRTWPVTTGPEQYRRRMYIHLRHNVPYPMLTIFEASDASVACLQRERPNSQLQALTLLNDPVFFEAGEKLGDRLAALPGDIDGKLRHGFELCMSRPPEPAEMERILRSLCIITVCLQLGAAGSLAAETRPFLNGEFKGRIAYSADGNHNEPDDGQADGVCLLHVTSSESACFD
jgi:hypothetical protein